MALAFLFAGQGAQKVGMGASLCDGSAAARALYDQANQLLGWNLRSVSSTGPDTELTQTKVCQPALFTHGLATLAALRAACLAAGAVEAHAVALARAPLTGA